MSHSVIDAPQPKSRSSAPQSPPTRPAAEASAGRSGHPRGPGVIRRSLSLAAGSIGPMLVLTAFAGIFAYGHQTDWTVPKFAELTGTAEPVVADWCSEHSVPESICVECDATLMPQGPDYGWCNEHGVHNCVLHHPDVAQLEAPTVLPEDEARAERALATGERKRNNSGCILYQKRIQFASVDAVREAGVEVELIERRPIIESVSGSGEIIYDPTRLTSLASRVSGSAWSVEKNVGDQVREGEVLALVDASEVGELKTKLLGALAEERLQQQNVERLKDARGAVAGSLILDAQAAYAKARADVLSAQQSLQNLGLPVQVDVLRGLSDQAVLQRLRLLGIPDSLRQELKAETVTANLLPVRSSLTGVVVARAVTPGEMVGPQRSLFRVADTSQMWLMLDMPLESLDRLGIGQTVKFRADGSSQTVQGELDWISTSADQHTRMVEVRAILPNSDGRLRDKTFGTGEVVIRQEPQAIAIPTGAAHWEGCCQIAFVRNKNYFDSPESPKVFHVRSVRLGATQDGYTEVISGVLPGEVVATAGSDVLRAQLLKNGLGAGCCVEE